ncbi:MAG: YbjN domain-containing protein [Erythrobacter sp.]
MNKTIAAFAPALALSCALATPAFAQGTIDTVTAQNPAEMTIVMMNAGYDVELLEDGVGDPMIASTVSGMPLRIYFYDCDDETHEGCNSIQLSTGFDREKPWNEAEALAVSTQLRFAAVRLDDEGDPFISWDIVTGDGIPTAVFLESLERFGLTVDLTVDIVFADEYAEEASAAEKE